MSVAHTSHIRIEKHQGPHRTAHVEGFSDPIDFGIHGGIKHFYQEKYGREMENIPLGAVGIYTFSQKIRTGLQQFMAGSRNFNLSTVSRKDLMSLTEEAAKISGIPYVMDAYREEAERILG